LAVRGDAKALIVEGDAWDVIKEFDDESIDAIITDSGYTCLNKHYMTGTPKLRNRNRSIGFKTRDVDSELLGHMHRVLKPGGHFFSFLPADARDTLEYNNRFIEMSTEAGFEFNKRFIWDKQRIGMGYSGRSRYEQIIFLSKGKRRRPCELSIPDVLSHRSIPPNKRVHRAEKPVALIKDLLKFCSDEGDTVLDLFAGSLSLAYAGLAMNRNTVSVEIDPDAIQAGIHQKCNVVRLASFA